MLVNLNQYRATVGVFNNHNSAQCNSYDIGYSQSFQDCSSFSNFHVFALFSHFDSVFGLLTLIHNKK